MSPPLTTTPPTQGLAPKADGDSDKSGFSPKAPKSPKSSKSPKGPEADDYASRDEKGRSTKNCAMLVGLAAVVANVVMVLWTLYQHWNSPSTSWRLVRAIIWLEFNFTALIFTVTYSMVGRVPEHVPACMGLRMEGRSFSPPHLRIPAPTPSHSFHRISGVRIFGRGQVWSV